MLLSVVSVPYEPEAMERRFGFRQVRPLRGDTGQERFGVVDLADGAQAAVLRLFGRDGGLNDPAARAATVDTLAAALPATPVQFVLSRRPGKAILDLPALHRQIQARFADRPEIGAAVWEDFNAALRPRLEAAGLADVWAGVAVAAPDAAALAQQIAGLYVQLPFEVTPLLAGDLGRLLGRFLRPDNPPTPALQAALPWPFDTGPTDGVVAGLLPRKLVLGEDAVSLAPDTVTWYWLLTPPWPHAPGGWLGPLLTAPALHEIAWDLAVHLRPAEPEPEAALRGVLESRLARITADLAAAGGAPTRQPPPGAPLAATDAWLLELERRDLAERLASLAAGRDDRREATVLLALHAPAREHDTLTPGGTYRDRWQALTTGVSETVPAASDVGARFGATLADLGLRARPVRGRRALAQAVRALLPLAAGEGLRTFPVGAAQAAHLALLPAGLPPPPPAAPLLGLTADGSPFRPFPEAEDLPGHRLIAGGAGDDRRWLTAQWALTTYVAGLDLLIFDPLGQWAGFVTALGGRVVRPGAAAGDGGCNLLAPPLPAITLTSGFEAWGQELAALLAALLARRTGQPPDVLESQVGAALLQLGLHALEEGTVADLTLDALRQELQRGGYVTTAEAVRGLSDLPEGRLFLPGVPPPDAGLLCIGPPDPALPAGLGPLTAAIALRRALAQPHPGWRACLLDPLPAALGHGPLGQDLYDRLTGAVPDPLAVWGLIGPADLPLLLAGPHAPLVAAFPSLVLLAGCPPDPAQALGVPAAALPALPALAPDEALVCQDSECWRIRVPTGDFVRRVIPES
jgi:hypothetical protein